MDNYDKDNYETPDSALDLILEKIDKSLVIWEPFYCTGRSGEYMRSKGYTVIHENKDFFTYEPDSYDIIVTNPPYSKRAPIFERLKYLNKPFSVLVPISTICNQYFTCHEFGMPSFIIPKKRVQFLNNGALRKKVSFDAVWVSIRF
jgi:hypothetical protein